MTSRLFGPEGRDVWKYIFSLLSLRSVARLEQTCKYLRDILVADNYYEKRAHRILQMQSEIIFKHVPAKVILERIPHAWGWTLDTPHIHVLNITHRQYPGTRFNAVCDDHDRFCAGSMMNCSTCGKNTCNTQPYRVCVECRIFQHCFGCQGRFQQEELYKCSNCHVWFCKPCHTYCQECYKTLCRTCTCPKCETCVTCRASFLPTTHMGGVGGDGGGGTCSRCHQPKCNHCFSTNESRLRHDEICGTCLDQIWKIGGK